MRDLEALLGYLAERQMMPHAWGRRANDCVSFFIGAVKAQTGRTRIGRLTWSGQASGLRVLRRLGGMEAAIDAHFRRIAPAQAMRGDIAGVADPDLGLHPMIVEGTTLVAPGPGGLRREPRSAMIAAWSATDPVDADE